MCSHISTAMRRSRAHAGSRLTLARDRGFSLIELLVVVIVVGLIAAIAVPVFLRQRTKAVDASLIADVKQARMLMQGYQYENTGSIGNPCYSSAACAAAGGPTPFLVGTLNMKFSPGNRVGDFWGGGGGGAENTFHLCIENVGTGGTPTRYRAIDTWGTGGYVRTGPGGCPWLDPGTLEPEPAP